MSRQGQFFQWQSKTTLSTAIQILAVLTPLFLLLGAIGITIYVMGKHTAKPAPATAPSWTYNIIADRVYSGPALNSEDIYPLLANTVQWGALSVHYPYHWIHFFEERLGGQTLTIQSDRNSPSGIHIQAETADNDTNVQQSAEKFLKRLRFNTSSFEPVYITTEQGVMYSVRYLSQTNVPMIGHFVFVRHNNTLYRIIQFSQEKYSTEYTALFKAILEALEFNTDS
ncbi:MAG: hypothetical protein AB1454_06365 [Candidatus Auribacterota bacterium]